MNPIISKIRRSLERDRELPFSARLAKGGRYVAASALAPVFLRDCTRVGQRARTIGRPRVENRGELLVGDDLTLNSSFSPAELVAGPGARLELGHGVAINYGTLVAARASVRVGDRVSMGPYCIVADHEQAGADAPGETPQPVEIGDDVWLAGRVTVLPGAKIGAGSVITAGSVVGGVIPPGVVAGGIPARVLRKNGPGAEPAPAAPAAAVKPAAKTLRGLLLADFTAGDLATRLRDPADGVVLDVADMPFCQTVPTLMAPPAEGAADFVVVWTRPELVSGAFQRLLGGEPVRREDLEAEVDAFCQHVLHGAKGYRLALVPTWTQPWDRRGLGLLDARPGLGATWALAVMNARLMEKLSGASNTFVLDASRWLAAAGRSGSSAKGWYVGKVLYQGEVLAEAARDMKAAARAVLGQAKKLVVLDLDDTLWGGIVGDAGWQNLHLGGHDPASEAFVEFQRELKALTKRGIVLGIVSKNEESVALEAIESHPEMVLRKGDFVGWRINWSDKARNVAELVQELNLGLQSVVFIDDNPVERGRVKEQLPEVTVPDWPEDKLLYAQALRSLRLFDTPSISREDAERTQLYASERQREELKREVGNLDDWLKGLDIRVKAEPITAANLARTAQLFNKTNQMNLSTRRLTEAELRAWAEGPNRALWAVHVADRFGDAGLTGIVSVEREGEGARIVDFILSCRVFSRKVENTMAHLAVDWARAQGATRVEARYQPTAKNKPTLDFFKSSGFASEDTARFIWDAAQPYALPDCIRLNREGRS